jgi:protein involved in polysaccharide export with SLBB domain
MKFAIKITFVLCFITFISMGQAVNPNMLMQFRSVLASKGVGEEELRQNLKQKGLNVDSMTEADALKNRNVIEQSIGELEKKNKAKTDTQTVNKPAMAVPATKISTTTLTPEMQTQDISPQEKQAEADVKKVTKDTTLSKIYGHQIFNDKSIEAFRISKDASPPDSYILAAGDKINIIIFGKSQADLQYEINSEGFIQPARMPKIFLNGLTLKQAKALLANRFSSFYVFGSDQFALTLNTSRTLTVNIFGEVAKPASYTTSALNTAINVLSASGGPNELGSVRAIQIIRGSTRKLLDIYAFMKDPILQFDFFLQNNDIIYVPPAEIIVRLEGSVNRPMQYEMKKTEGIQDLISFAGGLKKDAFTETIQIQRYENNKIVLQDYNLADVLSKKVTLHFINGDIVRFKEINSPLKTIAKISGAVFYPGEYDIVTTKTIKQLTEKARINPEAKLDQAFIFRKKSDLSTSVITIALQDILSGKKEDFVLQNEDSLLIYEQARYVEKFSIAVVGDVKTPFTQQFKYGEGVSVQEAIALAGGLKTSASSEAYIYRTDPFSAKKTTYIPVTTTSNTALVSGDQLVVLNKEEYEIDYSISIGGEVNKPLKLRYDPSLSMPDLIRMAGGITLAGDLSRVDVFRLEFGVNTRPTRTFLLLTLDKKIENSKDLADFKLSPFDVIVVRRISDFKLNETVQVSGEVNYQGPYILKTTKYQFSDLIRDAGGLTPNADLFNTKLIRYIDSSGILVFDAQKALEHKGNLNYDPILYENDYIEIPKISAVISIDITATKYRLAEGQKTLQIIYQGSHSAKWYLTNFAGGLMPKADKSSILVIRQNGLIKGTKKIFGFIKKYPTVHYGDMIKVSYEIDKVIDKKEGKSVDWDKALAKIISLGTLFVLIAQVTK